MEDYNKSPRLNQARARQANRYRRQQAFVTLKDETSRISETMPRVPNERIQRAMLFAQDAWWYIRNRTPALRVSGMIFGLTLVFVILSLVLSPNIGPNIWTMGMPLAGKSPADAELALMSAWQSDIKIKVNLNGVPFAEVSPEEMGLRIDAAEMVKNAKAAGLSGLPFGTSIEPLVRVDDGSAQRYLLEIVDQVYIPAYEAGYAWQNGGIVGVPGTPSRELNIPETLDRLKQSPKLIVQTRTLDLVTESTAPMVTDPTPYLAQAESFVNSGFKMVGYDPFRNEYSPWATTQEEMTRWLAAGPNSLTVRPETVRAFALAINERLNTPDAPRYLDTQEVIESVTDAVTTGQPQALLRVRYLPLSYEIASGDRGYSIARKTGMPFNLIDQANPGLDWNQLTVGQVVNLPSPDELLPIAPVANKRIIVDLETMWMVVFENGEVLRSSPISIGRDEAPTHPGVYQILTHNDIAYGSSFTLCSAGTTDCGQWEMYWFMGIYEVVPGLMNGFHGNVVLPNGALLGGGGGAQSATTFGCVMSDDDVAKFLYDWAEEGTMVEILSVDYPPHSELGRKAYDMIRNGEV
jgi:LysM repeat protein